MTRISRLFFLSAFIAFILAISPPSLAAEKIRVVTTFTILGDILQNVGREHVVMTTLVGPNEDAHVYEPTPSDARALADADLVFINGLGFEGWISRLIKASGYKGQVVVASEGIRPLRAENGAIDPHAWQNLANGRVYVTNIAQALAAADPKHSANYRQNAKYYNDKLTTQDRKIRRHFNTIPSDRRKVITSHDAFQYFGRAYGIEFLAPVGLSTESEPLAGEVAALVRQMRDEGIRALFVENITDPRLIQQLAREAGAVVGGTLYSDSLSNRLGPAATYINMFRYNTSKIVKALAN